MNYTKKVREYCSTKTNSFIDISVVRNGIFTEIPYKTLLKIFNRLEDEGIVQTVSKGLYRIGNIAFNDKTILKAYTANGKGMVAGYALFNKIGLTAYTDDIIEIYTNKITSKQKTIGRFFLKFVDLRFDDTIVDLIALLEILNMGYDIIDCNYLDYKTVTELLAQSYSDDDFRKINKAMRYKFATIKKLDAILEQKKIKNLCLEICNDDIV